MKTITFILMACAHLLFPTMIFGQAPNLRSAGNFVLFTTVGAVSNTGSSRIAGNVGSNDGAVTGFWGLECTVYNADLVTAQCSVDLSLAYTQLSLIPSTVTLAPVLGNGQVLKKGVYLIPQAGSLSANLTLDGEGDSTSVFIFRFIGAFTSAASSSVKLINGALASNVFWQVEGAAAFATYTTIRGVIIANNGAISMGVSDTLEGRALSTTGAVSVYGIILPVKLIDFKLIKSRQIINLIWNVSNEIAFSRYEVERSVDGHNFETINTVIGSASHSRTYMLPDNTPLPGISYYRLKMISKDETFSYSLIVKNDMGINKQISVYTDPVIGHKLLLQMHGQPKGNYILNLYNVAGQKVVTKTLTHNGSGGVINISLNNNIKPGMYYLMITDYADNKQTLKLIIE